AAGAVLLALLISSVSDRAGAGDEHDTAALRVARVERGDRVVRHEEARARGRDALQELTPALAIGLAVAARRGKDDRLGAATAERLVQRGADGALRIGG